MGLAAPPELTALPTLVYKLMTNTTSLTAPTEVGSDVGAPPQSRSARNQTHPLSSLSSLVAAATVNVTTKDTAAHAASAANDATSPVSDSNAALTTLPRVETASATTTKQATALSLSLSNNATGARNYSAVTEEEE